MIEHLLPTRWDQRYAHSSRTRTADANAAVSTRSTRGPSVTTPGCAAAEFGVYGPEGEWLIEGHGVDPDRVVDNLPHATFLGEDAQLEAAIDYLKKRIRESERRLISPRELITRCHGTTSSSRAWMLRAVRESPSPARASASVQSHTLNGYTRLRYTAAGVAIQSFSDRRVERFFRQGQVPRKAGWSAVARSPLESSTCWSTPEL